MRIGFIGLGKMGGNMVRRLLDAGHETVVMDLDVAAVREVEALGAIPATSHESLVSQLHTPRVVWMMVPAGQIVDDLIRSLAEHLEKGDILIDGGNTYYRDSMRRAEALASEGIRLVDVGTSGGIWGLQEGYSMMVGGDTVAVDTLEPVFEALAPAKDRGWGRVGPAGAGHFTKMIHNGIEYGAMQAFAEGFALMAAKEDLVEDVAEVGRIWQHGSVIRSWLLDLSVAALEEGDLERVEPWVQDSGEGRWTVKEAIDLSIPAPVITASLMERFTSRDENAFAHRMLAALRSRFGGHSVREADSADRLSHTTE
jgi:6-phosphogluconate dehydrogenase